MVPVSPAHHDQDDVRRLLQQEREAWLASLREEIRPLTERLTAVEQQNGEVVNRMAQFESRLQALEQSRARAQSAGPPRITSQSSSRSASAPPRPMPSSRLDLPSYIIDGLVAVNNFPVALAPAQAIQQLTEIVRRAGIETNFNIWQVAKYSGRFSIRFEDHVAIQQLLDFWRQAEQKCQDHVLYAARAVSQERAHDEYL